MGADYPLEYRRASYVPPVAATGAGVGYNAGVATSPASSTEDVNSEQHSAYADIPPPVGTQITVNASVGNDDVDKDVDAVNDVGDNQSPVSSPGSSYQYI